jgi:hypothetical protein
MLDSFAYWSSLVRCIYTAIKGLQWQCGVAREVRTPLDGPLLPHEKEDGVVAARRV